MPSIQEFFAWGMDRTIPDLPLPLRGMVINLGPGDFKVMPGTIGVGPASNALTDVIWEYPAPLPYDNGSVSVVHAHHFLEHFDGEDAVKILREIERVLMPGGVAYITTPYPGTPLQYHALDHKSNWNEETWQWLFNNPYYSSGDGKIWRLSVQACFIMGIVIRNLALFTQLVKI